MDMRAKLCKQPIVYTLCFSKDIRYLNKYKKTSPGINNCINKKPCFLLPDFTEIRFFGLQFLKVSKGFKKKKTKEKSKTIPWYD